MPSKSAQKAKKVARTGAPSRKNSGNTNPNARAWNSLDPPLSPWVLEAVSSMGFEKMTPVQASTIPLFMGNKDVVVEAVTGSGKTLAFLIPLVERLLRAQEMPRKGHVAAVVVSPTRELASQIYSVLLSLLAFHGPSTAALSPADDEDEVPKPAHTSNSTRIKPLLLLGGNISPAQDLKTFLEQSPTVLVGTPGRLNELLASQHVHCSTDSFDALVLDEADRLLDLGFKETLTKIMSRLPKQRRTGLFSASISDAVVGSLVRAGLRNPVKVVVKVQSQNEEKRTPASLEMAYLLASPAQRLVYLQRILSQAAASIFPTSTIPQKTIIYVSNCASVDYFATLFAAILPGPQAKAGGYTIVPLHGKQSPNVRQKNFSAFTGSTMPSILLTTDLAARGLDIPEVDLVIQMDAPTDPKVFLHRCGRAGRAGRKGLAVLFLSKGREEGYVDFLEVRKTPVTPLSLPDELGDEPSEEEVETAVGKMRAVVLRDRALHDKGMKAFVSHVRAHSKHQTTSIFRVQDLDWKDLAGAFALIRMPKMPELRKEGAVDVDLGVNVDMATYAYKDKAKEKARLEVLANPPEAQRPKAEVKKKNMPWSEKVEEKETKEARRSKKRKRRDAEKLAKMTTEEKAKEEEWKDLVEEVKRRRKEKAAAAEETFEGFEN